MDLFNRIREIRAIRVKALVRFTLFLHFPDAPIILFPETVVRKLLSITTI